MSRIIGGFSRIDKRIIIILILVVSGCGPFSQQEKLSGNYQLYSTDSITDTKLVRMNASGNVSEVLIDGYVFSVGYDDSFILVKRNIRILHQKKVEWYIIDTKQNIKYGPFDESAFNLKRKELGVNDSLEFTRNTDNLGGGELE